MTVRNGCVHLVALVPATRCGEPLYSVARGSRGTHLVIQEITKISKMRFVAIACLVACVRGQGATEAYVGTNDDGDVTINGPRVLVNGVDLQANGVDLQAQVPNPPIYGPGGTFRIIVVTPIGCHPRALPSRRHATRGKRELPRS